MPPRSPNAPIRLASRKSPGKAHEKFRSGDRMKVVEFDNGVVQVDAAVIAEGLGIAVPTLRKQMQAGKITSLFERGIDADNGRHRVTFFSEHRRLRLVVDERGAILQRSMLNFGSSPLPASVRK